MTGNFAFKCRAVSSQYFDVFNIQLFSLNVKKRVFV